MVNPYQCEICFETYTSYRAMMICEEECIAADEQARRPVRNVPPKILVDIDD